MLTEVCGYLNNYFDIKRCVGSIKILDGTVYCDDKEVTINEGQYFALFRKNFALGVYQYGEDELEDKEFDGAVWLMDIPQVVLGIVDEITSWQDKYGKTDSAAISPFNSESFGGYSYTKGSTASSISNTITWQDTFKSRLAQYKKVSMV